MGNGMDYTERMRDSATPSAILPAWHRAVAGYLQPGDPYQPWAPTDWARFAGQRKLPIFVQTNAATAHPWTDADQVVRQLRALGVPKGCYTAIDLESVVCPDYVEAYGDAMHLAGYKTWVYGSVSTVFGNPELNGYWVANYANAGPFMVNHPGVRATQYASPDTGSGGNWDSTAIPDWVYYSHSWWR